MNNDPLSLVDPDGEDGRVAVLVAGLAVPGVGEVLLAVAGAAAVGYLTYETISFFARKQLEREVKKRSDTLAKHLANYLGRSVAGRPPDPNWRGDKNTLESYRREIEKLFRELKEKVGGNLEKMRDILSDRGWKREAIDDFMKAIEEANLI